MTWLKIGDELGSCRPWLAIEDCAYKATEGTTAERLASARSAAAQAKFVHLVSSMWGADCNCDGLIPGSAISQICAIGSITESQWLQSAQLLQEAKMWDPRRERPWRMLVCWQPGDQPTAADEASRKMRGRRRAALQRKDLPNKLQALERAAGECEYCGAALKEGTTEIDHIDPNGWNELANLAAVCTPCNRKKGDRSLKDVRMSFTSKATRRREKWEATS